MRPGWIAFIVAAMLGAGLTATATAVAQTSPNAIIVTPDKLPNGTLLVPYDQQLGWTARTNISPPVTVVPPVTFAISGGQLPAGLKMDPTGHITGSPTATGPADFTVKASDSVGNSGRSSFRVTVAPDLGPLNDPARFIQGLPEALVRDVECLATIGGILNGIPFNCFT